MGVLRLEHIKTESEKKHPTLRLSQLPIGVEHYLCSITIPNLINSVWAFKTKEQRDRFSNDLVLEYSEIHKKGDVTGFICKARVMAVKGMFAL